MMSDTSGQPAGRRGEVWASDLVDHPMRLRLAALVAAAPLLAVVACSGTAGTGVPGTDEANATPVETPKSGDPIEPFPEAGPTKDASTTEDAGHDATTDAARDAAPDAKVDAGPLSCTACLAAPAPTGCKAEQDACNSYTQCKLLDACLDACLTTACKNTCFATYPDPEAKARNGALYKCQCTTTCATSCKSECD